MIRYAGNKKQMNGTLKTKDQMVNNRICAQTKESYLRKKAKKGGRRK